MVLVIGVYWWWQQDSEPVVSVPPPQFVDDEMIDEGGEVMNDQPMSLAEVIDESCVGAGGYKSHIIEGMESEGLGVVHNVAYVECKNGEEEAYYLGEPQ